MKNVRSLINEVFTDADLVMVKEAQQGEILVGNTIYVNPADYHMQLTEQMTIDLSHSKPINFSRPSIDVTMESVAGISGSNTTGIILTGANIDGADGLRQIHDHGGKCIVQDPREAVYPHMPEAALGFVRDAQILKLHDISKFLQHLPSE